MKVLNRPATQINASSMADIAFLLLTFFLITTVIPNDKGLLLKLPPTVIDAIPTPINERNIFKIQINSMDAIMVEGNIVNNLNGVRSQIKQFILNNGKDHSLSDSPMDAVVSLAADRGTSHKVFISVLDEMQGAYFEIYGQRAGLSAEAFRNLDLTNPTQLSLYEKARKDLPMNISIAEPTKRAGL